MTDTTIPFGRPMMGQEEIDAVTEVLSGPTLVHGAKMRGFEEAFAKRIGVKHAIAVSNCTAGLHLSLFVKEIGAGDTVALGGAQKHALTDYQMQRVAILGLRSYHIGDAVDGLLR